MQLDEQWSIVYQSVSQSRQLLLLGVIACSISTLKGIQLCAQLLVRYRNNALEQSGYLRLIHSSQVGQEHMQLLYYLIPAIKDSMYRYCGQLFSMRKNRCELKHTNDSKLWISLIQRQRKALLANFAARICSEYSYLVIKCLFQVKWYSKYVTLAGLQQKNNSVFLMKLLKFIHSQFLQLHIIQIYIVIFR